MSTLVGLTLLVAALIAILLFTLLHFRSAARQALDVQGPRAGSELATDAMQEAFSRLRDRGREMQARAEASEQLSEHVIGSMQSGLLLVDADGTLRIINAAACRLLGVDEATANGHYGSVLVGASDLCTALRQALTGGPPLVRHTVELTAREQGPTYLSVSISPVAWPDGRPQSMLCLFDDVTAMMGLEERLRLQDSFARVGELTAGIAHEFRNGLATIHGYARLIDPGRLPAPYAEYVSGIRAETAALGEVVSNFLNFARPSPLTISPVDLRILLDRAADDVRGSVEASGGAIEIDGDFPMIDGDDVLLRQAFSNLCRNAWEACESVGRPARIRLTGGRVPPDHVRIVVSDNGSGIAPAAVGRLFQPFFTTRSKGTGLGLALVQKIIVTHDGHVTVTSEPEQGAAFTVVLPVRQTDRPA